MSVVDRALASTSDPATAGRAALDDPLAVVAGVVDLGAARAATEAEGRWGSPSSATAAWLAAAARTGIGARDCTYEVLDWRRDRDPSYAGTVRVGPLLLDLRIDGSGVVRVASEDTYWL